MSKSIVGYQSAVMPMRVQARPGSQAEQRYAGKSGLPGRTWPMPKAIAKGIDPSPLDDLLFHGGKVVPQMEFQNIYLGGLTSWRESDIESIDSASSSRCRTSGSTTSWRSTSGQGGAATAAVVRARRGQADGDRRAGGRIW